MKEKERFVVDEYSFGTKAEWEEAKREEESIQYIRAKTNLSDPQTVYKVYCGLVEKKTFTTPVGTAFLLELRAGLLRAGKGAGNGGINMGQLKILVVDDESRMRKLVRDFLVKGGYYVLEAENGEDALDVFFQQNDIALVITDVMMPKMDGWQLCREIRQYSQVPIIMLTAKSDERDELMGFEMGVDEYISKPFSPKILVARVDAVLRRTMQAEEGKLEEGGIVVDRTAHRVTIDGGEIDLSVKEFELLTYFMINRGVALSREKILNNVWNYDYFGDARTIDTHVKKLRSKMGAKGDFIKTIWGMGYKFETSV